VPPELLNDIGDAPLVKQRSDGAIELFRFNVAQHPTLPLPMIARAALIGH